MCFFCAEKIVVLNWHYSNCKIWKSTFLQHVKGLHTKYCDVFGVCVTLLITSPCQDVATIYCASLLHSHTLQLLSVVASLQLHSVAAIFQVPLTVAGSLQLSAMAARLRLYPTAVIPRLSLSAAISGMTSECNLLLVSLCSHCYSMDFRFWGNAFVDSAIPMQRFTVIT
jgi:hypothetical protein